ncbi:MAG: radical protein [Thermoleophilia bacterium]|nr:radical protein [Thermoleophilia bacterium]
MEVTRELSSDDGSTKLALRTDDGHPIEAVLMRFRRGGGGAEAALTLPPRLTACLSSQSGCALSCTFCATGRMRLRRSLTQAEIVEQLHELQRRAGADARIDNIVMMGMGEPFHNYDNVLAALTELADPRGAGIAPRRMTISTVGWVPGIERLAQDPLPVRLALSLHAPNDELRGALMPVNRRYPIARLMEACELYQHTSGRSIFIEYLLLAGQNDSLEHARELAKLLDAHAVSGAGFHVNLIAYNPTGTELTGSPDHVVQAFRDELRALGLQTSWRISRARDIAGACGQLAAETTAT